jgi:hypothetical protein
MPAEVKDVKPPTELRTQYQRSEIKRLHSELMKLEQFLKRSHHGMWAKRLRNAYLVMHPYNSPTSINYDRGYQWSIKGMVAIAAISLVSWSCGQAGATSNEAKVISSPMAGYVCFAIVDANGNAVGGNCVRD